jgi:predicted AAA+ superfamily ATPase
MIRAQKNIILKDLEKKIVLLVGPRQSGKTYLAKDIATSFSHSLYLNYDQVKDRKIIKDQSWIERTDLLILDELHKMPDWKNYLKGVFDTKPETMRVLITGSARLDIYDRIGDSLAGRYFRHRLLPLSLSELKQSSEPFDMDRLIERGGFPEPYFASDRLEADRWRAQYINSLLSTDVFEIETIHNLKGMRLVFDLLRNRVGSPVSYQSLAEDVGVSPMTIKKYIQILESIFVIFIITPYSRNIARSLLKEPKIYFFDTALVQGDEGVIFENFIAVSLLKSIYARVDSKAEECSLHYLRTKDGYEVDFAVIKDKAVEVIIEAKLSEQTLSKPLRMFHEKYQYPSIQLSRYKKNEYKEQGIEKLNAVPYLSSLYL